MSRKSWSSQKPGPIRLEEKKPSDTLDVPQTKKHAVPKAALEEGILQLLASAAEMQQRQDFGSALQLYQAAMEKIKAHDLNRKRLLTGTSKKPPPLNSRTPLHWSLHVGDIPSAICLLGSPNAALSELRNTVSRQQVEQVLDAGADVEYRIGPVGRTLLLQEAAEGRHDGVRLALDRGANISVMDDNGDTALALAIVSHTSETKLIIEDLMAAGGDLNSQNGSGQPLFAVAIAQGQPGTVAQVISVLSPLDLQHAEQMKTWAIKLTANGSKWSDRSCNVLRLLIGHGLDPNLRLQPSGTSLLEAACESQSARSELLVGALLDHGARPKLEAALRKGNPRVIEILATKCESLQEDHTEEVSAWVENLQPNPKRWPQRTVEIFRLLLNHGLDPNFRLTVPPHSPLILCAAKASDLALVEKLIALKARLNVADDNSDTALICAAQNSNRPIYDALKQAGVNDSLFFGLVTVWSSHQRRS
ncbi:hypothetical protein ACLMJK_005313 [Lecanora helva]